jgi:hypothetical protein
MSRHAGIERDKPAAAMPLSPRLVMPEPQRRCCTSERCAAGARQPSTQEASQVGDRRSYFVVICVQLILDVVRVKARSCSSVIEWRNTGVTGNGLCIVGLN